MIKDGRATASGLAVSETPTPALIKLMTGRDVANVFPDAVPVPANAPVLLEVNHLHLRGHFSDVDFTVRAGEIVGLAGLVGSGRSEILETIYGARKATSGSVAVQGKTLRAGSVGAAVDSGMGFSPEERKSQGLILDEPIFKNVTLSTFGRFSAAACSTRAPRRRRPRADRCPRTAPGRSGTPRPHALRRQPAEDPPRPLARARHPRAAARRTDAWRRRRGTRRDLRPHPPPRGRRPAIVVVSSEIEEVLGLSDRVLVIGDGDVLAEENAADIDESGVLDLVMKGSAA